MKPYKILLLEGIHPVAQEVLEKEGFAIDLLGHSLKEQELTERISEYHALGIRSKTQVREGALKAAKNLMVIGNFCIGTNQVDLKYASSSGVPVFNAPYCNTRSVAELVISEIIALSRKLVDCSSSAHRGEWNKSAKGSFEIRGKTLGIIGYGHIGSQVSVLAESMGLRIIYYDIVKKLPLGNALMKSSLKELLGESDFVSLHVPMTDETHNMMNSSILNLMKKNSYLINASRGSVVDIEALVKLLKSEYIAGAAIDVFPKEPQSNSEKFVSELQGLPNVILTPHIGGSTEEAQQSIGREVSYSLINYLNHGLTDGSVNFPQLSGGKGSSKGSRILNIHKNRPGVLGQINNIVSSTGANIKSQFLSTKSDIGYLIMDMELEDVKEVAEKIKALPTSIQTRIV